MPKKNRNKKTYDIDPELSALVDDLSAEYGVPKSQVANLLLTLGAIELFTKKINIFRRLSRSDSPAYQHDMDIEDIRERLRSLLENRE